MKTALRSGQPGRTATTRNKIGVNRLRTKILALVLLLMCLCTFALAETQSTQTVETLYTAISGEYTLPVYAGEDVVTEASLSLPLNAAGEVTVTVAEDAQYEIWLSYVNTTTSTLPTEMTVTIDGEVLCAEMQRVKLNSLWVDDGVFPTDRYGNEIATTGGGHPRSRHLRFHLPHGRAHAL